MTERPIATSLELLEPLQAIAQAAREAGWTVNLAIETGATECVTLSAAKPTSPPE